MSPNPVNTIRIYILARTAAAKAPVPDPSPDYRLLSDTGPQPLDPSMSWSSSTPIPQLNAKIYVGVPKTTGAESIILTWYSNKVESGLVKIMKDNVGAAYAAMENCHQVVIEFDEGQEVERQGKIKARAGMIAKVFLDMDELDEREIVWKIVWVDVPTSL